MKYKCITKCFINDVVVMNPGDIIVINDNKLFNVTTGIDYRNISNIDNIKSCLEVITDDITTPYSAPLTDIDRFRNITKTMLDTFSKKNHDYGNSFEQSLDEEGLAASRIRMGDKWNRFKNLSKGKTVQVNDESIRDTLLDLAAYSIMTMIWLDKNGND